MVILTIITYDEISLYLNSSIRWFQSLEISVKTYKTLDLDPHG